MRQHMLRRVGRGVHRHRGGAFAVQEVRRVAFGRVGQQLDDDVQQLGHAGAGACRHEAHRDQVALAQRLLQRRVQLGGVDVAVVQVTVDEGAVDLHHLLDQRAVRASTAPKSLCPRGCRSSRPPSCRRHRAGSAAGIRGRRWPDLRQQRRQLRRARRRCG
jgi:hypothetical protein